MLRVLIAVIVTTLITVPVAYHLGRNAPAMCRISYLPSVGNIFVSPGISVLNCSETADGEFLCKLPK